MDKEKEFFLQEQQLIAITLVFKQHSELNYSSSYQFQTDPLFETVEMGLVVINRNVQVRLSTFPDIFSLMNGRGTSNIT